MSRVVFAPNDTWQETGPGQYTVTTSAGLLRGLVNLGLCPLCGAQATARVNRSTGLRFAGCSAFPRCKFTGTIVVHQNAAPPISLETAQRMENGLAAWDRDSAPDSALDRKFSPISGVERARALQDAATRDPFEVDPQGSLSWDEHGDYGF